MLKGSPLEKSLEKVDVKYDCSYDQLNATPLKFSIDAKIALFCLDAFALLAHPFFMHTHS